MTRTPFGYEIAGPRSFRLCADFARTSPAPPPTQEPGFWTHSQGHHCFEIEVETEESPSSPVHRD